MHSKQVSQIAPLLSRLDPEQEKKILYSAVSPNNLILTDKAVMATRAATPRNISMARARWSGPISHFFEGNVF
jgi:hypothetical protein